MLSFRLSFRKSARLSALSLLLAAGLAGAANATPIPINYNINFDIGSANVTGTIQTDGTLGVISPRCSIPARF